MGPNWVGVGWCGVAGDADPSSKRVSGHQSGGMNNPAPFCGRSWDQWEVLGSVACSSGNLPKQGCGLISGGSKVRPGQDLVD